MTTSTPSCFPRQFGRGLGADDLDFLAVDDENIVFGLVGGGFFRADLALETALGGIVFEQVSEVVGRHDVADGDDFDVLADHALLGDGAENEAADAAESIDCNFNSHNFLVLNKYVSKRA